MNCVNHPDQPVASYCQNCGKALCADCVRPVASSVYCEQCLAERLGHGPAAGVPGGPVPVVPSAANPGLAALLGFIPGVGAMYNGQYVKAIVHVLVFVVLVGLANHYNIFGFFIAAWIFYQVFEAYHTAKARRFGLPLPDPFGLNDLGNRIGLPNSHPYSHLYTPPFDPVTGQPVGGAVPPAAPPSNGPFGPVPGATGFVAGAPPAPGGVPYTEYVPIDPAAAYPLPPADLQQARREPIGAIVLIGLGMLFLFSTLGIFHFDWIGRGWPLILIGVGVWLLVKRARGAGIQTGGKQ
jgi:TM2 domain-containing membrane protein YozV